MPYAEIRSGNLWTAPDGVNTFIQVLIGFLLGAIWPCISDILHRLWSWLKFLRHKLKAKPNRESQTLPVADEREPLLRPNSEEPLPNSCQAQRSLRHPRKSKRGIGSIFVSILITLASIAWALGGSFFTTVSVGESGLSSSKTCGSYSLKANNTDPVSESRDDLVQAQKESRAGQYGRECYPDAPVLSPDHCNFFDSQAIPSHLKFEQQCPFENHTFCNGNYTAVTLSTGIEGSDGFVDASVLGLHSTKRPRFRRTSTCVPLNMRQGFIKQIPPDSDHIDNQFEYYLGPVSDSTSGYEAEYTFKMFGDPSRWEIPTYLVK